MPNLLKTFNFAIIRNIFRKCIPLLSKIGVIFKPFKAFFKKHHDIVNPICVLTAICLIVAAALSLTNSLTASRIAAINLENKNKEMAALIPADSYGELTAQFEDIEWAQNYSGTSIYEAKTGDTLTGYLVTNSAKGYGGEIVVMTAFNTDRSVKGISILNADKETPGLGQNITKPDFYSQFSGLKTHASIVKTSADNAAGEIKAVTGATISSKGTVNAVNEALAALEKYLTLTNQSVENNETEIPEDAIITDDNGGEQIEE